MNISERILIARSWANSCEPSKDNTLELTHRACSEAAGCLVECGVFAGTHPALMALASTFYGGARMIHLFDSFEGIPKPGPNDGADIRECLGDGDGELESTGISSCSVKIISANFRRIGLDLATGPFIIHPGWFQETAPASDTGPIALLRLDGDLYESTKVCMEHLYPRVSPGGFCIIDDYALDGCRMAVDEYLALIGESPEIVPVPDSAGVVWWRKNP